MINRCQCSVLHTKSLRTLDELAQIYDYENPVAPTDEQIEKAAGIIARSRDYAQ